MNLLISDKDDKQHKEMAVCVASIHLPRQTSSKIVAVQAFPVIARVKADNRGVAIGCGGEYVAAILGSKLKVFFAGGDEENSESVQ